MDFNEKELYETVYKEKFSFGKNWSNFLNNLTEEKIDVAQRSISDFLNKKDLKGKIFIDVGCGSGLFSLSAYRLNAKKIISIDVDDSSLKCAAYLKKKFANNATQWKIKKGSILDEKFIRSIGKGDIIYSWGVLHHTGNMWKALHNVCIFLKRDSLLYLAIYNKYKKFPSSNLWKKIKRIYAKHHKLRFIFDFILIFITLASKLLYLKNPFNYIKNYKSKRGMSFYTDVVDWLGGYPYEFATTKEIINFYKREGLRLINLKKAKGISNNEFLFRRNS